MKEAIETLATFELFKVRDPSQFSIERLGGLTNKNFKVVDGENKYVLRIPGEGTEAVSYTHLTLPTIYSV